MIEQRPIEQRLAERGWFTTKVKPKKRGVYRTTRMDLVESNNAGGAYSTWDGKKWGPAKSESGSFWGDYSGCSNMLWAESNTPFVTLKEISDAVGAAAKNEIHSPAGRKPRVHKPIRPSEAVRDKSAAGVQGSPELPAPLSKLDDVRPKQKDVSAHAVGVWSYCPNCGTKLT